MTKEIFSIYSKVERACCDECDAKPHCKGCTFKEVLNDLKALDGLDPNATVEKPGCAYCTDKKGKRIQIYWDDNRGGLKPATFCPNCGKEY